MIAHKYTHTWPYPLPAKYCPGTIKSTVHKGEVTPFGISITGVRCNACLGTRFESSYFSWHISCIACAQTMPFSDPPSPPCTAEAVKIAAQGAKSALSYTSNGVGHSFNVGMREVIG